jgi:hypothetical protein
MSTNLSDRPLLKKMRQSLEEALRGVESEYGVTFELGAIRYDADGARAQLKLTVASGDRSEAALRDFRKHASLAGLDPSDFGREIVMGKNKYKITGIHCPSRGALKVNIERLPDGAAFLSPVNAVLAAMKPGSGAPVSTLADGEGKSADRLAAMMALLDRMAAISREPGSDFVARLAQSAAILNEMNALSDSLPYLVGKLVRFQVADGYAYYLITGAGERFVQVRQLPEGDDYQYSGVVNGRLDRRVAERAISQEDAWKAIGAKKAA